MAQGILKYNLEDFDDRLAFNRASKSLDLTLALWDFNQAINKCWDNDEIDGKTLELIQEYFNAILEEYNIDLDELVV